MRSSELTPEIYARALGARDARFDGLFYVGITTTRIYCRPVCPARVSYPERRRFFQTAAAAEGAGFRPCMRCRPELAPGRALMDAVPQLARVAAHRIAAGALNGRGVAELARELGVSERHLRRALERELGVSPIALAQTHRLLLAKRLLADTSLSVTRIAFASGFQSLRRFNSVFRAKYRKSPSALRRNPLPPGVHREGVPAMDLVRLTLAYRAPFAWDTLTEFLRRDTMPGVELVQDGRYGRTVQLEGKTGVIFVENGPIGSSPTAKTHLHVDLSPSLLSVLMPLLARLRHLFDLDAEPTAVDECLAQGGLRALVRRRPGIRVPGAFCGFEVALRALLRGTAHPRSRVASDDLARRVVWALGAPIETEIQELSRLSPSAERVANAGAARLVELGAPTRRAAAVISLARSVASGAISFEPGVDVGATRQALMELDGVGRQLATTIVMRALYWPDAFPAADRALQRAAGAANARELLARSEQWRPWRAYAALHLWLRDEDRAGE